MTTALTLLAIVGAVAIALGLQRLRRGPLTSSDLDQALTELAQEVRARGDPQRSIELRWSAPPTLGLDAFRVAVTLTVRDARIPPGIEIKTGTLPRHERGLRALLAPAAAKALRRPPGGGRLEVGGSEVRLSFEVQPRRPGPLGTHERQTLEQGLRQHVDTALAVARGLVEARPQLVPWLDAILRSSTDPDERAWALDLLCWAAPDRRALEPHLAHALTRGGELERLVAALRSDRETLRQVLLEVSPAQVAPQIWNSAVVRMAPALRGEERDALVSKAIAAGCIELALPALAIFAQQGQAPRLGQICALLERRREPDLMVQCAGWLAKIGHPDSERELLNMVSYGGPDPDQELRVWLAAIAALAEVGSQRAARLLREQPHLEDAAIKPALERAIGMIEARAPQAQAGALALVEPVEQGALALAADQGTLAIAAPANATGGGDDDDGPG